MFSKASTCQKVWFQCWNMPLKWSIVLLWIISKVGLHSYTVADSCLGEYLDHFSTGDLTDFLSLGLSSAACITSENYEKFQECILNFFDIKLWIKSALHHFLSSSSRLFESRKMKNGVSVLSRVKSVFVMDKCQSCNLIQA